MSTQSRRIYASGTLAILDRPRVRPIAENAEQVAMCVGGVRELHASMPMLELDLRDAAIVDALVEHGSVTLTVRSGKLDVEGP